MANDVGPDWLREAVRQYERPLMAYALRLVHHVERAQDIVQDTFLRLCDQSPESRRQIAGHLAEWLFTVCRNRAVDVLRKHSRVRPMDNATLDWEESAEPLPGQRMEQDESVRRIIAAIDNLPQNQQECIRLKFQGGLAYKEIARVTGLTTSYVGWLIHTGLKTVRQGIAEQNDRTRGSVSG
jgi:RNA polymerase sigma factor (sigma-70 family)